jgi:hypothetical protein
LIWLTAVRLFLEEAQQAELHQWDGAVEPGNDLKFEGRFWAE